MQTNSQNLQNEQEILKQAAKGETLAAYTLVVRYTPLVLYFARKYIPKNADYDDLVQEGMIGLLNAISSYNPLGGSFKTYAAHCINNKVISALRSGGSRKNSILKNAFPLGEFLEVSGLQNEQLDPQEIYINNENYTNSKQRIYSLLSVFEKEVFEEYLKGSPYKEIAYTLNSSQKSVDNALQRIKRKLQKLEF